MFFYKERKRTQRMPLFIKNAAFFYKEHKRTQRTKHSFIKNVKELKNVAFFWKELMPNPATDWDWVGTCLPAPCGLIQYNLTGFTVKYPNLVREAPNHKKLSTCQSPQQHAELSCNLYSLWSNWSSRWAHSWPAAVFFPFLAGSIHSIATVQVETKGRDESKSSMGIYFNDYRISKF